MSASPERPATGAAIGWFLLVGAAAAGVHYVAALLAHGLGGLSPAVANVLGFGLAFPVSYAGHRSLTFRGGQHTHAQALPRFFAVAVAGFLGNQVLMLGLVSLSCPFWLALGVSLVAVAASTFLLSKLWAFR